MLPRYLSHEFQKNKVKNIRCTQPWSGKEIYPVIIRCVLSYKDIMTNTHVNTLRIGKQSHFVKAIEMYTQISNTLDNMTGLGFGRPFYSISTSYDFVPIKTVNIYSYVIRLIVEWFISPLHMTTNA